MFQPLLKSNFLFNLLFFVLILSSNLKANKIALIPFLSSGIDSTLSESYSDRLENLLVRSSKDTLIERTQLSSVLKEKGLKEMFCEGSDCQDIGTLLNADKIITGRISKVQNIISVSSQYIDVNTGTIEKSVILDFEGDEKSFLTQGIDILKDQLLGKRPHRLTQKASTDWETPLAWSSTGLSVGSFLLGWHFNTLAKEAFEDFEQQNNRGLTPKTDEIEKYQNLRKTSYISGSVFAINALLMFWAPWKSDNLSFYHSPKTTGVLWSMSF